jgi:hypothetical protein
MMRCACRKRRSLKPASLKIAVTSHKYVFLLWQPVASSFPSSENDIQLTGSVCWSGELMVCPLSGFHDCVVLLNDAFARMRSFGAIAMPKMREV